ITCVPGGVDAELFAPRPSPIRASLGLADAEVVLFVGRLVPMKNLPLLLDAFALLRRRRPRSVLLLAGEARLQAASRPQARRLGRGARTDPCRSRARGAVGPPRPRARPVQLHLAPLRRDAPGRLSLRARGACARMTRLAIVYHRPFGLAPDGSLWEAEGAFSK